MRCKSLRFWCLAGTCLILSLSAYAKSSPQSVATTLQDFGMLGVWAPNCGAAAGPSNQYQTVATHADGFPTLTYSLGSEYKENLYVIQGAERVAPDRLLIHEVFANQGSGQEAIIIKANGQTRVWWSKRQDGTITVSNGLIRTANDRPTNWQHRCGN
jgi:hypothetical protein